MPSVKRDSTGKASDFVGGERHTELVRRDGGRAFTANQSMGGNKITSLGAPVLPDDAARLQDVGAGAGGLDVNNVFIYSTVNALM